MSEIEKQLHTGLLRIREEIDTLLATLTADQPLPRFDLASRGIAELLAASEDLTISIRKHTTQEEIAELHRNIQLQASREAQLRAAVQELHAERTVLLAKIETDQGAATEARQLRTQLTRTVAERDAAHEASRGPRDVWRQEGSHETHEARRRDLAGALGVAESTDWVAMISLVEQLRSSAESTDWGAMISLVEQLRSRAANRAPTAEPTRTEQGNNLMNPNFTTPELWNTFDALRGAARDCTSPPSGPPMGPLMGAAVAFTTQLAIDAAGRDRDEAHTLERELLSTLETWRDEDGTLKLHLMVHDLECVIGALSQAAHRYTLRESCKHEFLKQAVEIIPRELTVAAVAFTIQLAIDEAGREPSAMRSLERSLISRLEEPWKFAAIPVSVEGTHGETWGPPPKKD